MEEIKDSLKRTATACERIAKWLEAQQAPPVISLGYEVAGIPYPDDGPQVGAPPTVDADGRVWDARIDSSAKSFNADGRWKARRGVAEAMRARVLAELAEKAVISASLEVLGTALGATAPPPPATEQTAPPPPAEVAPVLDFKGLVKRLTDAGYTLDTIGPFLEPFGATNLPMLLNRPETWLPLLESMGIQP